MFLTTMKTRTLNEVCSAWHSGWWLAKIILLIVLMTSPFVFSSKFIHLYGKFNYKLAKKLLSDWLEFESNCLSIKKRKLRATKELISCIWWNWVIEVALVPFISLLAQQKDLIRFIKLQLNNGFTLYLLLNLLA